MATAAQIAALRVLIAEPGPDAPYDDATLGALIDAASSIYDVAYVYWTGKTAATTTLVDMSEGGSTRKMGDVSEKAWRMAQRMRQLADENSLPPNGVGVRVSKLTRP